MKKIIYLLLIFSAYQSTAQKKDTTSSIKKIEIDSVIFTNLDKEAQFPGGEQEWIKYIQKEIEKKINKLSKDKASDGTCIVQFIVDKEGAISNVEALTMQFSLLSKIVVDAIKKGPRWIPAEQNGRKVKAYRRQPVTFRSFN